MVNFKERTSPQTTFKLHGVKKPRVFIDEIALKRMFLYTKEAPGSNEIGWLGTAYRNKDNEVLIDDVFLFRQQVHGATTEITAEGLSEFAEELLQREDGMEVWNNMKVWGHSHVEMGISPSGQDDKQMDEFSKNGHDFMIRLITNRKGELGIDLFDYETGISYHNIPWEIHQTKNETKLAIQQEIDELYTQIEALEQQIASIDGAELEELQAEIKAEIAEKVSTFTYPKTKIGYTNVGNKYHNAYYNSPYVYQTPYTAPSKGKEEEEEEEVQVNNFFDAVELYDYANKCFTIDDFYEELYFDGLGHMLSDGEKQYYWKVIKQLKGA